MKNTKTKKKSTESPRQRTFLSSISLVVVLVSIYTGVRIYGVGAEPAQLKFVENPTVSNKTADGDNRSRKAPEIFGGEVYRTTVRLRESGAIGMATAFGVFSVASSRGSFPTELRDVWAFVESENLLPPGVVFENGELRSDNSRFRVSYRHEPFGIEVIGEPLVVKAGEASVIVRLPLPTTDGKSLTYYQSSTSGVRNMPAPFETPNNLVAAGWTSQQWRGEILANAPEIVSQLEAERKALAERGK